MFPREDVGYWELPKPHKGEEKEWHVIVRMNYKTIPFGYKLHEDNPSLLEPIPLELEALELAKRHLKQYSLVDVSRWLEKQTGRYITTMGLKKRVDIDNKRKRSSVIKRRLAKLLQETLQEIQKLEEAHIGAYSIKDSS